MAATIGVLLAAAANKHVFGNYPKQVVAVVIFLLYTIMALVDAFGLVFNPDGPSLSLNDIVETLASIFQGIVTCGMIWLYFWPNRNHRIQL
jgi:hypothetical protein